MGLWHPPIPSSLQSIFSLAVVLALLLCPTARASPNEHFGIAVVDDATHRGIPLVELRTVHKVSYWTDSNGWIAFQEPGLMDEEVYFHVSSPGYEYPVDGFGNRGVRLRTAPGATATVRLKRVNVAERLYRLTGAGIYRDSLLLGREVPLRQPVLNGLVFGQDTVIAVPYRAQLYWFWGDTDRPSYPLGNFAASGATSDLPGTGGLDPAVGVNLTYFVDSAGFARAMCPGFGRGLHWIESVMTVPDETGRERLVARISSQEGLTPAYAWHLAVFDDAKGVFDRRITWDLREGHDSAHPFRARVDAREYLYLYPNYRVPADLASLADLSRYEAYTCLAQGTRVDDNSAVVDRDATGRPRYSWKGGMERLHPGRVRQLVARQRLQPDESWLQLIDVETGRTVPDGRGSVCWNDFRNRWVMIVSGAAGDIWFAEADTPTGPWTYARRIVTHGDYNFYNPTQHPFFDQDGGRIIYFEGTYTAAFSRAKAMTPRYDYNQLLYRLSLDDPRLDLPAPVYRVRDPAGRVRLLMRDGWTSPDTPDAMEAAHGGTSGLELLDIAFFALPSGSSRPGTLGWYHAGDGHLTRSPPESTSRVAFRTLPPDNVPPNPEAPATPDAPLVTLFEDHDPVSGYPGYRIDAGKTSPPIPEAAKPIARVWRKTSAVLTLDPVAQPVPQHR